MITIQLGADSLDGMELIMIFEDEFKIDIPDNNMDIRTTVRDIVDYIVGKIK